MNADVAANIFAALGACIFVIVGGYLFDWFKRNP